MKKVTQIALTASLLASCSSHDSVLKGEASDPACPAGQEKLTFTLSADADQKAAIEKFQKEDNPVIDFVKNKVDRSYFPRVASDSAKLNICYDTAADQAKSLLSAEFVFDFRPVRFDKIEKVEGLNEAIFGDFDKLDIKMSQAADPNHLLLIEGSKILKGAVAATVKRRPDGGLKWSDASFVGTFSLFQENPNGCPGNLRLSESKAHVDGVDLHLKYCIGETSDRQTVSFQFLSILGTDTKANPPLNFALERGRQAVDSKGQYVLSDKNNENVFLTYEGFHHNRGDTFQFTHPQIEVEWGYEINQSGFRVRRNKGAWTKLFSYGQSHFLLGGIGDGNEFQEKMVLSPLLSALGPKSGWFDLYINGAKEICSYDEEVAVDQVEKLNSLVQGSAALTKAIKDATADQNAQFKKFVQENGLLSAIYSDAQSVENSLAIISCGE